MRDTLDCIVLHSEPLLSRVVLMLKFVLNRTPSYGDVAEYLAYRFTETCLIPVNSKERILSPEVLSLDIYDHLVFQSYRNTQYAFNIHGCALPLDLIVFDNGLYFIKPGVYHVARESYYTPVPILRDQLQKDIKTLPQPSDYRWRNGVGEFSWTNS